MQTVASPPEPRRELPDVEYFRVDELTKILRVGRSAIYEAIKAGELPAIKIGRLVRVPRAAIASLTRVA